MLDTRRHMELFDPDTFTDNIHIIGAGATGSWLTLALAKLGIKGEYINVYDFDTIEEHNIPNQAFSLQQIGEMKVEALRNEVAVNVGTEIKMHTKKFVEGRLSGYVFMMVDSMKARKEIWERSIKQKSAVKLLIEPRMGLDMSRIYNVNPIDMSHITNYEDTFYTDEEAETSACGTSQTVITTAMSVASHCVRQLINNHKGDELDNEILADYAFNNLVVTRW
jgi:molybdopterin/thiamine biosynthesis adenylyltransferase